MRPSIVRFFGDRTPLLRSLLRVFVPRKRSARVRALRHDGRIRAARWHHRCDAGRRGDQVTLGRRRDAGGTATHARHTTHGVFRRANVTQPRSRNVRREPLARSLPRDLMRLLALLRRYGISLEILFSMSVAESVPSGMLATSDAPRRPSM